MSMDDKATPKPGLQHIPTGTALSLHSPTRTSIIARGRRDAANAASNPHYRQAVTDFNSGNFTEAAAGFQLAAELLRITRQIQHAERDIAALDAERNTLLASEIAQLHLDAEAAAREHRDLLTELATNLREQIADAQRRFELIDRQISAHGK